MTTPTQLLYYATITDARSAAWCKIYRASAKNTDDMLRLVIRAYGGPWRATGSDGVYHLMSDYPPHGRPGGPTKTLRITQGDIDPQYSAHPYILL